MTRTSDRRRRSRRLPGLFAALCIATALPNVAAPAYGDEPTAADLVTARKLFNTGLDLRDAGDEAGALSKFVAADALAATPKTRIEVGRSHLKLGHLVEAHYAFVSIKGLPVDPKSEPKYTATRAEAIKLAAEVAPRLSSITLVLTGLAPGEKPIAAVDGVTVPPAAMGEPRAVDPGKHVIAVTVGSRPPVTAEVELKEGESRSVELAVPPAPPKAPPTPAPTEAPPTPAPVPKASPPSPSPKDDVGPRRLHSLAWVGATVGGAGLLVGSVAGIVTLSKSSSLHEACDPDGCPESSASDLRNAKTWATVSTVSFVVGGVGAALFVTGLMLPSTSTHGVRLAPTLGVGTFGLSGAF